MRECSDVLFELFEPQVASCLIISHVYNHAPQCKSAFAGQASGYCLSMLEAPPTASPTTSDFTVDFWYPGERCQRRLLNDLSD